MLNDKKDPTPADPRNPVQHDIICFRLAQSPLRYRAQPLSRLNSEPLFGPTSIDIQFHDTYFVIANTHVMILLALISLVFSATYAFYPAVTGRVLNAPDLRTAALYSKFDLLRGEGEEALFIVIVLFIQCGACRLVPFSD